MMNRMNAIRATIALMNTVDHDSEIVYENGTHFTESISVGEVLEVLESYLKAETERKEKDSARRKEKQSTENEELISQILITIPNDGNSYPASYVYENNDWIAENYTKQKVASLCKKLAEQGSLEKVAGKVTEYKVISLN